MISFTRRKASLYRSMMNTAAESLPDNDAVNTPMLFENWVPDKDYISGKKVCYQEELYKVLQDHHSQIGWEPDVAVSLFAKVLIPDSNVIPEWVQPGSTNPYMKGDKVRHNDKNWVSTIDNNVWEPGVYGWEEIE